MNPFENPYTQHNHHRPWDWSNIVPPEGTRQSDDFTLPSLHNPFQDNHITISDDDDGDGDENENGGNHYHCNPPPPATTRRDPFLANILNSQDDAQDPPTARGADSFANLFRPPPQQNHTRMSPPRTHGYIDLTQETTPPLSEERSTLYRTTSNQIGMSPSAAGPSKRRASDTSNSAGPSKRARPNAYTSSGSGVGSSSSAGSTGGFGSSSGFGSSNGVGSSSNRCGSRQDAELEQVVDLLDDSEPSADDSDPVANLLQKQRAEQVQAQKKAPTGDAPTTFSNFTCVICMDTPTDLTATACGHVFCHTCLMEALIAGENRATHNGEPRRSQCPVCRKTLSRNKPGDVIPLTLKLRQPRRRAADVIEV